MSEILRLARGVGPQPPPRHPPPSKAPPPPGAPPPPNPRCATRKVGETAGIVTSALAKGWLKDLSLARLWAGFCQVDKEKENFAFSCWG